MAVAPQDLSLRQLQYVAVVETPESHPACQFLVPPTAVPPSDAATEAATAPDAG